MFNFDSYIRLLYLKKKSYKICLVCSRGGHLFQLYSLKQAWQHFEHYWITHPGEDTFSLLKGEKIVLNKTSNTRRNFLVAIANFISAFFHFLKEKPSHVISTGAAIGPPYLAAAKLLNITTIFIEPIDFIHHPTISGKISHIFVDYFLIQSIKQRKFYKKSLFLGKI